VKGNIGRAVLVFAVAALAVIGTSGATTAAVSFSVLHNFSGPDGETPAAPLVQGADGFLYGVAAHGGDFAVLPPDGGGTAFRVNASGTLTTLHRFVGPEGAVPNSLIQGRDGFFYGTATYGGSPLPGNGTLFRMDAAGAVSVLHVFPYAIGGGSSLPGPIVQGADGALYGGARGEYGTNAIGGYIYRFDPVTGDFRHLHDFVGSDGAFPTGPLFQAADGFFYGTTNQGGSWNSGVVFKVDAVGHFVLLHGLSPLYPGEGSQPKGGVIQASDGLFYGTTEQGGYGGEIFRMDAAGNFTVIHRFDAYASDGSRPTNGLIEGRDGFLYGTAPVGGQPVDAVRYGVVYRMDKAGTVTVVHTFTGPDGTRPTAALAQGADGGLYGSTVVGGAFGLGVLFRVDAGAPAPPPPPPPPPPSPTAPTITSFTPTTGPAATRVTINGTNFNGVTSVKFNAKPATQWFRVSSTKLVARVPAGATTGKISVTNASGTGTSSGSFTVT
jgi:uncharacterized repeat protein (TIGR03803 family)